MAALTATAWTISSSDIKTFREDPYRRVARMQLTVTDGEYPSNGVPIPVASRFGLRVLRSLVPLGSAIRSGSTVSADPGGGGIWVNYDHTNKSIRMMALSTASITYQKLAELATTLIPGSMDIYVEVNGH